MIRWLSNAWYEFACWGWRRHTTIKPRTLSHTWTDRCDLLPHMMFEILGQFLERECSPGVVDWDSDDKHRAVMAEMRELWRWWNEDYLKADPWKALEALPRPEWKPCEMFGEDYAELVTTPEYDEAACLAYQNEKALEAELKARCKRLIDIMEFMWT